MVQNESNGLRVSSFELAEKPVSFSWSSSTLLLLRKSITFLTLRLSASVSLVTRASYRALVHLLLSLLPAASIPSQRPIYMSQSPLRVNQIPHSILQLLCLWKSAVALAVPDHRAQESLLWFAGDSIRDECEDIVVVSRFVFVVGWRRKCTLGEGGRAGRTRRGGGVVQCYGECATRRGDEGDFADGGGKGLEEFLGVLFEMAEADGQ